MLNVWIYGSIMAIWTIWVYRYIGIRMYGYMDIWLWMYGDMDACSYMSIIIIV